MKLPGGIFGSVLNRLTDRTLPSHAAIPADLMPNGPALPAVLDIGRMLKDYRQLRRAGEKLQNQLVDYVGRRGGLVDSAGKLGLMRGNALIIKSEHDLAVVSDYALFCHRVDGLNVVEQCARETPPSDPVAKTWLQGMLSSHFSLFMAIEKVDGFGLRFVDVFSGDSYLVADVNLSATGVVGLTLATRLIPLVEFSALTGASLPILSEETLTRIKQYSERNFPKSFDMRSMDSVRATAFQTFVTRTCLEAHSSAVFRTSAPGDFSPIASPPNHERTPGIYSRKMKIGRNEPCPCGSGEKYKRCCGRGVR